MENINNAFIAASAMFAIELLVAYKLEAGCFDLDTIFWITLRGWMKIDGFSTLGILSVMLFLLCYTEGREARDTK